MTIKTAVSEGKIWDCLEAQMKGNTETFDLSDELNFSIQNCEETAFYEEDAILEQCEKHKIEIYQFCDKVIDMIADTPILSVKFRDKDWNENCRDVEVEYDLSIEQVIESIKLEKANIKEKSQIEIDK